MSEHSWASPDEAPPLVEFAEVGANGDGPGKGRSGKPGRPKFNARRLADELVAETPIAATPSRKLYVYREGAYRPDGEEDLLKRVTRNLGDEWRRNRAAETIAYLRDSAPRLLAQPPRDLINVRNGILDLQSGELESHTPEFLSPVQLGVAYEPGADCPQIDRFLADILAPELHRLVYELVGYLATPDNALQTAVMLLGEGSNGKSTFLSLIMRLLGLENCATVALHRLDEDRFSVAELEGKLANIFADLDARALQASSMFKAITGGDAITGERKYHPAFSFTPFARLLYSANEPPPTADSSDAFFRRWLILPFERRFDGRQARPLHPRSADHARGAVGVAQPRPRGAAGAAGARRLQHHRADRERGRALPRRFRPRWPGSSASGPSSTPMPHRFRGCSTPTAPGAPRTTVAPSASNASTTARERCARPSPRPPSSAPIAG